MKPCFAKILSLIFILISQPACRLGNKVEVKQDNARDPYIGYFQTLPTALTFCSNLNSGCTDIPSANVAEMMPTYVKTTFSNPIEFNRTTQSSTQFFILNHDNHGYYLPVELDRASGNFNGPSGASAALWLHSECTNDLSIQTIGSTNLADPVPFEGFNTLGRISAQVSWAYNFTGNCAQSLLEMKNCYLDHDDCLASSPSENLQRQLFVNDIFGPWIDAGLLGPNDFTSVSTLTFDATYQ